MKPIQKKKTCPNLSKKSRYRVLEVFGLYWLHSKVVRQRRVWNRQEEGIEGMNWIALGSSRQCWDQQKIISHKGRRTSGCEAHDAIAGMDVLFQMPEERVGETSWISLGCSN